MDCNLIVRVSKKIWDRYNEFWCERFQSKIEFCSYYEVISYVADAVKFSRQIRIPDENYMKIYRIFETTEKWKKLYQRYP